jgi:alpha-ketoglutarate-dependent taurine dioxygenase
MLRAEATPQGLGDVVELGYLNGDDFSYAPKNPRFPRVIRPKGDARFEVLEAALTAHRAAALAQLHQHGAVLLRGFEVNSSERFEAVFAALGIQLSDHYPLGAAARRRVGRFAWTTTELTDKVPIPPHSEMAYRRLRPRYLGFYCAVAPKVYGETPIFDARAALADLPPSVRAALEASDVTWCQYFPRRRGLTSTSYERSWPEEFGSDDRAVVERVCEGFHARCEWLADGRLGVVSDTPSIFTHPETGEPTLAFQTPTYEPFVENLRRLRDRHGWALNTAFVTLSHLKSALGTYPFEARDARGARLSPSIFLAVLDALWRNASVFRWQEGDVLVLDNALAQHGRLNVVRPRTVYVVLGGMHVL